jgi:DNA-binding NarL/FixJ family response regulator
MRVVLADDQMLLRAGVARLLEDAGMEVVAQAGDAEDLLRKVGATSPTWRSSTSACRRRTPTRACAPPATIRERHPGVGVLVLSGSRRGGLRDGALRRRRRRARLPAQGPRRRPRPLRRERAPRRGRAARRSIPRSSGACSGRRRREDPLEALTPREREVLGLMAEGRSNRGIAEQLVVSERAVEKHVTSIFTKLGLAPAAEDHRRVLAVLAHVRAP